MENKFDLCLWDPQDEEIIPQFLEVLKAAHETPQTSSVERFLWKHKENPSGPSIFSYAVDVSNDEIAAVQVFSPRRLFNNNVIYSGYESNDTSTHPDYFKMGLFSRLLKLCMYEAQNNKACFVYGFPNFNSIRGLMKADWKDISGIEVLVKPLHLLKTGLVFIAKRDSLRSTAFQLKDNDIANSVKQTLPDSVEDMLALREQWKGIWAGYRSKEMLEWRFLNHPFHHYEVVDFEAGIAFVLLGQRGPLNEGKIVDVFFQVEGVQIRKAIKSLIRCLRDRYDLDFLSVVFAVGHPYYRAFKNEGFYKAPSNIHFCKYTFNNCPAELVDKPWALTGADIDTQ